MRDKAEEKIEDEIEALIEDEVRTAASIYEENFERYLSKKSRKEMILWVMLHASDVAERIRRREEKGTKVSMDQYLQVVEKIRDIHRAERRSEEDRCEGNRRNLLRAVGFRVRD